MTSKEYSRCASIFIGGDERKSNVRDDGEEAGYYESGMEPSPVD